MADLAAWARPRFPGLDQAVDGRPAVFLDGPAGSQVPQMVADAVAGYLLRDNGNAGGAFPTSRRTDAIVAAARAALADLFAAEDPDEVVLGPNMTSLTFLFARLLMAGFAAGDEVVVTDLDHDANVTPWIEAARAHGVHVRAVAVRPDDCTLDLDSLRAVLGPRTRLVAFSAASNLVGTLPDVAAVTALCREVGALTWVDAVHYAPHRRIDVHAWGCDFAVCSAYKFFGPHVGALWGRRALLDRLRAERVRPAPAAGPARFQQGTPDFEGIAGTLAAVEYLAELGRAHGGSGSRRQALDAAFAAIAAHESALCARLLDGLRAQPAVRVVGIGDPARVAERAPTVSLLHARLSPAQLAAELLRAGIFTWPGNAYALPLTRALGLEPEGVLRAGLLHYHDAGDVDRLLGAIPR